MASNQLTSEQFNYNGIAHRFTEIVAPSDNNRWGDPRMLLFTATGNAVVVDTRGVASTIVVPEAGFILPGLYTGVNATDTTVTAGNIVSLWS